MRPAFSTVAFPHWPLARIAELAGRIGALGVELRTFGSGSRQFSCDPALSDPAKVRRLLNDAGARACCVATGCTFDKSTGIPVLGHVFDDEQAVREAKWAIDLASELECPMVRVFAFQVLATESRTAAVRRIADRLGKVADHARNRRVRVALENGGSFNTAAELAELMDAVASPELGAAYSVAVAAGAGERPAAGLNVLGERLLCVKLKDFRGQLPCAVGLGDVPCSEAVKTLAAGGWAGWCTYEYDCAWLADGNEPDAESLVSDSIRTIYGWIGAATPGPMRAGARASRAAAAV